MPSQDSSRKIRDTLQAQQIIENVELTKNMMNVVLSKSQKDSPDEHILYPEYFEESNLPGIRLVRKNKEDGAFLINRSGAKTDNTLEGDGRGLFIGFSFGVNVFEFVKQVCLSEENLEGRPENYFFNGQFLTPLQMKNLRNEWEIYCGLISCLKEHDEAPAVLTDVIYAIGAHYKHFSRAVNDILYM